MKKMMTKIRLQGILIILLLWPGWALSQGFEQHYIIPVSSGQLFEIIPTSDGGYAAAGTIQSAPWLTFGTDAYWMKMDVYGDTSWVQAIRPAAWSGSRAYAIKQTSDGGYILAGNATDITTSDRHACLIKIDAFGDTLWTQRYFNQVPEWSEAQDVVEISTGGYLLVGGKEPVGGGPYKGLIIRTDALGDTMWTRVYTALDDQYEAIETSDGNFVVVGEAASVNGASISKINAANGNFIWTENHQAVSGSFDIFESVDTTSDGGYIAGGSVQFQKFVVKTDAVGVSQWNITYPNNVGVTDSRFHGIRQTFDGGYIGVGFEIDGSSARSYIAKLDPAGSIAWEQRYGVVQSRLFHCEMLTNGDFIACGISGTTANPAPPHYYALLLDSLGNVHSNLVHGNVFDDSLITNCQYDSSEFNYSNWIVEVTGDDLIYGLTDTIGNYNIPLDSGNYVVKVVPVSPYVDIAPCATNGVNINVDNYDTVAVDFPIVDTVDCPYLLVDVSTPFLRRCFGNTYTVTYCNLGTADEYNASVEVELDPYMTYIWSSIPPASQNGNVFTFNVDTVLVSECSSFYIGIDLDCDSTVTGQTHCVEAHIFPDSLCVPDDPTWDQASIIVDAQCIANDSIQFKIENIGIGNMSAPEQYFITEENVMLFNSPFQLNADDSLIFYEPANGSTYRLVANQSPGHPWSDAPMAVTIEGCGTNLSNSFTTGLVTTMPEFDNFPFLSVDCQESIASYDPNDKRVYPAGYGTPHYIEATDELDYHIRFQNTGTDTAFTVVIRDTISQFLDLATIQPGASSHPYTYNITSGHVIEFTFNNILLPDSNVNEPASHGFVKFRINQVPNNPIGTVIENSAAIYFDFNPPVITNTTFNTIGQDFIVLNVEELMDEGVQINAYPNPFDNYTTITIEGEQYPELTLTIFDVGGKLVRNEVFPSTQQLQLTKDNLLPGMYFFNISTKERVVGKGKLIVN